MFISARKHVWVPRTYSLAAAGRAALTVLIAGATAICTRKTRSCARAKSNTFQHRLLSFPVSAFYLGDAAWRQTCNDATLLRHSAIRERPRAPVWPRDKCPPRRSTSLRAFTVQSTQPVCGDMVICTAYYVLRRQQWVSHGAVCPPALPHNVSLPFFFFGAGSEDRCKTESTLYGVEEARIIISEGAISSR